MIDLINRSRLLKEMSDWQYREAPFLTPDVAKEYTAKEMQTMIYRTIKDAMLCVADQPAVMTWIPVTERLPEKTGKYLVSVKNGNVYAGTFSAYEGAFNCAATAWMELPEPYKEPEDPSHPCADSVMMGDCR